MTCGGRRSVLLGFAGFGAFWGTWGATLPVVQRHARLGNGQLGVALVFVGAGALVSLRAAGSRADRSPWLLPVSLAAMGVAALLPVVAVGLPALAVATFLLGVTSGAVDASVNVTANRVEQGGTRVLQLGHGVFSVAVVVASLLTATVVGRSTRPLALVGAALALAAVGAVVRGLPGPTGLPGPGAAATDAVDRRRPLLLLGLLGAVAYLVENAWQSWGAVRTVGAGGSVGAAALAPAVFAAAVAAGRFGAHLLPSSPTALLRAGASTAVVGSLIGALAQQPAVVLAGIAIAGLGTSVCAPVLLARAAQLAPESSGAATGSVLTLAYLGFVAGPALVGLTASISALPVALAGVAALALILAAAAGLVGN